MEQAKYIVELLSGPPLNMAISVLDFCQKTPEQLQSLLYLVLSAILPPQGTDDSPEVKVSWMMELLRMLNYQPSIEGTSLQKGIAAGNKDVVYEILPWLLSQMEKLQKRAYLAPFMVDVEVPAELLLLDDDVTALHAQYRAAREHFKATHRRLDALRRADQRVDPARLRDLRAERRHLQASLLRARAKLQDVDAGEQMLDVVGQLKLERTEECRLGKALNEQQQALTQILEKHEKMTSKLQQMQALAVCARSPAFLQTIMHANSALRCNVNEKLPKDLETKRIRLRALEEVLEGQDHSPGLADLQAEVVAVSEELRAWQGRQQQNEGEEAAAEASKRDVLQMSAIVADKSRAVHGKHAALVGRRDQLLDDLTRKRATIEELKATVRRGEDLRQYVQTVRTKSAAYKKMKRETDELAAEHGVLLHTLQVLEQQCQAIDSDDQQQDSGQDGLVESRVKCQRLRHSIREVTSSIEEIRQSLVPRVKELKLLRAKLQELETEHEEKKKRRADAQLSFQRKVAKLEAESLSCAKELERETQAWRDTCVTVEKLQESVLQLDAEKKDGSVTSTLRLGIAQQEELLNTLHQKQQKLKETEHINAAQVTMMKDLLTLLATKLTFYSSGSKLPIVSTATSLETVDK